MSAELNVVYRGSNRSPHVCCFVLVLVTAVVADIYEVPVLFLCVFFCRLMCC